MVRMVCLANSWRPGGRCIAGIDLDSGQWVRPVPAEGGAIPEASPWLRGRYMGPLDVVEVDLEGPTFATRFQRENRQIRGWQWRFVRRADVNDVIEYASAPTRVLHGRKKVVRPSQLETLAPDQWTSLELVRSDDVTFEPHPRKPGRWEAKFSVGPFRSPYRFTVTDPVATGRLNAGGRIGPRCLLTVSLTEPIELPEFNMPRLCYKLVATVLEL